MFLTLYHDDKDPYTIFNVTKVTVDDLRTVLATTKNRSQIFTWSYRHDKDYQRLTVQVD